VTGGVGVFFDRDGVLCEPIVRDGHAYAPTAVEDFRLVPDGATQVARVRAAGLRTFVFTNQPEIASRLLAPEDLERMHVLLREAMPFDEVYVCPHATDSGCGCHKPEPGMLLRAATDWALDLSRCFVIGDRWRDIEAGHAVGCYTVLLERSYSNCATAHVAVPDLRAAVDAVLLALAERPGAAQ
jgi:D-glycero-D-manno-heptose 1,7-bisphosphate phosphatase